MKRASDKAIFNRILQVLQTAFPEQKWTRSDRTHYKYKWFLSYETEISVQSVHTDDVIQSYKTWIKNPGNIPPIEQDDSEAYIAIVNDFLANGW